MADPVTLAVLGAAGAASSVASLAAGGNASAPPLPNVPTPQPGTSPNPKPTKPSLQQSFMSAAASQVAAGSPGGSTGKTLIGA